MRWRRLLPNEIDYELIWLSVSVLSALVAWYWLRSGLPTPVCLFHEFTGWPCPGCGATRCVRNVMHGDLITGFLMNPMVFIMGALFVIYDVYAAIVLGFRLPRLRFDSIPKWLGATARFGIPAMVLINWGWLVYSKV